MGTGISEFIASLAKNGCQAKVVSISRLVEMEQAFSDLNTSGEIAPEFYPEIIKYFKFDWSAIVADARSIVVVASPQLPTRVAFGSTSVIIPPTYIYKAIWKDQLDMVKGFLEPRGLKVARARLPFKTLAVRSGLARYGRNNIAYIPGMGSFFRLAAFYSDLPCDTDDWAEPQMLSGCVECTACAVACPAGCISQTRFLIQAERCLTRFNEQQGPIPAWIEPAWHNSLLGCMACQQVCPQNKKLMEKIEDSQVGFSDSETLEILADAPEESLREETRSRLEALCLADDDIYPLLKRNLSLLLGQTPGLTT